MVEALSDTATVATLRRPDIAATRTVAASAERVFEFLSDLRNHWRLDDRLVELTSLDDGDGGAPTGGRVRISGPLGLSRKAATAVLAAEPPMAGRAGVLAGRADVGGGTVGRVAWAITPTAEGASSVTLAAAVERASGSDRLLLALGGRWWLERIFGRTLVNLGAIFGELP